jgi:ketosteroid isomerase-like protein
MPTIEGITPVLMYQDFVVTDTLGSTTARQGVWTLVLEQHEGAWKIVADQRTMVLVPFDGSR